MKNTLVIDCHYLCYRSMFTIGGLSFEEKGTGVVFGFLNQLLQLATKFDFPQFVFAWDSKRSYRRDVYPNYKKKEREASQDMLDLLGIAKPQFQTIRTQILPRLGFANNFVQTGLEADDIIAMVIRKLYYKETYIVSADNDLYQLLLPTVSLYDPKSKRVYGERDFYNEWGLPTTDWVKVKALAGCSGDGVKGIRGIGETTAVKFLKGELKGGKKFDLLMEEAQEMFRINIPLIYLPHPLTNPINLLKDRLDFKAFEGVCMEYGFNSFLKKGAYEKWKQVLS